MLVSVVARSLFELQFEPNTEDPKGVEGEMYGERCGIDPARNLDNNAALPELFGGPLFDGSAGDPGGLKGLVEGVGLEVLDKRDACCTLIPLTVPTGENLDGTVPARARRD